MNNIFFIILSIYTSFFSPTDLLELGCWFVLLLIE